MKRGIILGIFLLFFVVGVAYAIQSPSGGQVTITSTATLIETPTVTNPFTYSMTLVNYP